MPSFSLRVLVLEDHAFQRSVAVGMLKQLGCREVFEAADGAQALALLDTVGPVDIALCDLQMDGMDGIEFIQRVGVGKQVGSVIISSALSADLRRAVRQIISLLGLEFLGDVGKPLPAEELRTLLKKQSDAKPTVLSPVIPAPETATEVDIRRAIAEQQLEAWYQPKFNLLTREVCGVEVLTRWRHPSKGIVSPAVFMPTLERCGLIDDWLYLQMDQALSLQQRVRCKGVALNMAFNLHAMQLANSELITTIKQLLVRHRAPGSGLTFEVTESGLLEEPTISIESLVRLRMMGCRLSIDDFGVGFSSLQRLCQLPFNEIKLDGEFVRGLDKDLRCRVVVSSTLALGDALGMTVVAEGIETLEQRQRLIELGCIQGQGYLLGRPMTQNNFLSWLDAKTGTQEKD